MPTRSQTFIKLPASFRYPELIGHLRSTLNGSGNIYEIDAALLQKFRPAIP